MAQCQRLLTSAGFVELVFQLADFRFHARQRFINLGGFVIQKRDQIGELLFFNQRRTG